MIASVDRLFTAPVPCDPLGVQREAGGNSSDEPDLGQVLALLKDVLATQRKIRLELIDLGLELKKDIEVMRVELGHRLDGLAGQVASLREELASYHSAVVGRGVLISELNARLRAEQHPDVMPPAQS